MIRISFRELDMNCKQRIEVKVTFNDLNVYILEEVLKYLTLKDRIRFERVSKGWKEALALIWFKQKAIAFTSSDQLHFIPDFKCRLKNHEIRANDTFDMDPTLDEEEEPVGEQRMEKMKKRMDTMINMVSKCLNLKALFVEHLVDHKMFSDLSPQLVLNCPSLEHIQGIDSTIFYQNPLNAVGLKCLAIGWAAGQVRNVLTGFPSLESLGVIRCSYTCQPLNEALPQLKELTIQWFERGPVEEIITLGHNLTKLVIICPQLEERDVELISQKLLRLETISIGVSRLKYIRCLHQLKHLTDIQWVDFTVYPIEDNEWEGEVDNCIAGEIEEDVSKPFNDLVLLNGAKLTSISLSTFLSSLSFIEPELLFKNCSNLIKFEAIFESQRNQSMLLNEIISDEFISSRLRELTVKPISITRLGVINLLKGSHKLRHFEASNDLKYDEFTSETLSEIEDLFISFARTHPKRTMKLTANFNHCNQFTDTVKHVDNLVIYENKFKF